MDSILLGIVGVGGVTLLGLYVALAVAYKNTQWNAWLDFPKDVIVGYIIPQILAAVGCLILLGVWVKQPATAGVFRVPLWRYLAFGTLLVGACLWAGGALYRVKQGKGGSGAIVSGLIVTAIGSIWILAGVFESIRYESTMRRLLLLFGGVSLAVVCVLMDGVGWLSCFLRKPEGLLKTQHDDFGRIYRDGRYVDPATVMIGTSKTMPGPCGSKEDVHIVSTTNMTRKARDCALSFNPERCLHKNVGLSPGCAKIWNDNIKITRQQCARPCMRMYLLDQRYNDDDENLHPCLECDETHANFQGVKRRTLGVESEIDRDYL